MLCHDGQGLPNNMDEKSLVENIERLRATFQSGKTRPLEWRRGQLLALQRMFNERQVNLKLH